MVQNKNLNHKMSEKCKVKYENDDNNDGRNILFSVHLNDIHHIQTIK